jgi:hypothetical protein
MGYAHYTLPDGREAGYGVRAECDANGCAAEINRGLGYLCGRNPDGHKDEDEPGCGQYFCGQHLHAHGCKAPACGVYSPDEELCCYLVHGHEEAHFDIYEDKAFTETFKEADRV